MRGKSAAAALSAACDAADLVIVPAAMEPVAPQPEGCVILDRTVLDRAGAVAGWVEDGQLTLYPTRRVARIWMAARPVAQVLVVQPKASLKPSVPDIQPVGMTPPAEGS